MVNRVLTDLLLNRLYKGKAILLTGPRQTGKTTLLKKLFKNNPETLWLNGDDPATQFLLDKVTLADWKRIIGNQTVLVIDEAQRIANLGLKLKLLTDELPQVQVIASGSSAFELANTINEPLTGRKWDYHLFPLSFGEMEQHHGLIQEHQHLEQRLVYGYYPEIVTNPGNERELLIQLADSYLYKDILMWERIKKPEKLAKLLQALAYQVGSEVSYNELGQITDLDNQTVENYIALLEQAFIVFKLQPLSRNLRKELKTKRKIYFYDNGIRNAIIAQFQPLPLRQDIGILWENWFISERKKLLHYAGLRANTFFWRTQDQQEIDYIEERDGTFHTYELKWNPKTKVRFSKTYTEAYPNNECAGVNRENYFHHLQIG